MAPQAFLDVCTPGMHAQCRAERAVGSQPEDMLSITRDDAREDALDARPRRTRARSKVYRWDEAGRLERALELGAAALRGRVGSGRVGSRYFFQTHAGKAFYKLDENGHLAKAPYAF